MTVCVPNYIWPQWGSEWWNVFFIFSIAQCILRDGSTPSLDIVLICHLWHCLSLHISGSDFISRQCLPAAFQRLSCMSHSYPWLWRGPTWPWCLQHTLVTVGGFWLSWYLLRPATGPTSLIMKETLPSQAGWSLQAPGGLVHFVSPSWCCFVVWRRIERYPSHRPSMLRLHLYRCWCKHKAHLYVNTLCMDFLPEYFCTITVTFVVFKGILSFPENINCPANINVFHKLKMIF